MIKFVRLAALAAAATAIATPAFAQQVPVQASPNAQARARILKPLVLKGTQNLLFGDIVVGSVVGTQTVNIDYSTGNRTGCTNGLTCSGTVQRAIYNIEGSNGATVTVDSSPTDLENANFDTLQFTPNHPATVLLVNSGAPGTNFFVGGSIDLDANTPEGLYTGDMEITVQYP
jgi:hypothetical protein